MTMTGWATQSLNLEGPKENKPERSLVYNHAATFLVKPTSPKPNDSLRFNPFSPNSDQHLMTLDQTCTSVGHENERTKTKHVLVFEQNI